MIKFKDASKRLNEEWKRIRTTAYGEFLREDLREAVLDVSLFVFAPRGLDAVVTCILSTPEEDALLQRESTTHSGANRELDAGKGGRAIDVRAKDIPLSVRNQIESECNRLWWTGDSMPFCYLHGAGDGIHFHFQCARSTKLIKQKKT